jgi:apolipoprotein N-acyltransferase
MCRGRRGVRETIPLAAGLAVLACLSAYGTFRMRSIDSRDVGFPRTKIALVQPSIPARGHWEGQDSPAILEHLSEITRDAERRGASLTVWPEASYPYVVAHASRREPIGARAMLQPGVLGPVLLGLILRQEVGFVTNSATVVHSDGTLDAPQDKRHLLWFGEHVPLAESVPWIKKTFMRGTGMRAGDSVVLFEEGAVRAAVLNCFEDTLPEAGRELGSVAPNLLVNVTNDAWFFGSQESLLHERVASLRAVESRRHFVRAVNRGRASWFDSNGVLAGAWPGDVSGALIATPALVSDGPTPYVRFGDLPLVVALVASVVLFVVRRRWADKKEKGEEVS